MASVTKTYKVHYHFEVSGKKSGPEYADYVQAAANDYNSIRNVLSSNSKLKLGTLVIDAADEIGHGDNAIA